MLVSFHEATAQFGWAVAFLSREDALRTQEEVAPHIHLFVAVAP